MMHQWKNRIIKKNCLFVLCKLQSWMKNYKPDTRWKTCCKYLNRFSDQMFKYTSPTQSRNAIGKNNLLKSVLQWRALLSTAKQPLPEGTCLAHDLHPCLGKLMKVSPEKQELWNGIEMDWSLDKCIHRVHLELTLKSKPEAKCLVLKGFSNMILQQLFILKNKTIYYIYVYNIKGGE